MAHEVRTFRGPLKLMATVSIMICLSATNGKFFSATAMTIDQTIMAAATVPVQEAVSSGMRMSFSQLDVVKVELDMLFRSDDWEAMNNADRRAFRRHRRKALRDAQFRWPNAEIPYQLSLQLSQGEMQVFNDALQEYHLYTCIRFRQAISTDRIYVNIVNDIGCYSFVGRQKSGETQKLSLGEGCRHKGTIIHELAHALGFHHEQTRPDRDDFVTVRNENIVEGMQHNFQKYAPYTVDSRGVPYDYLSVMHYGTYYFSKNGGETIVTKNDTYQSLIGNAPGLSFRDVKLVNSIYACAEKNRCRKKECPSDGFVGQGCQCWCPSGSRTVPAVRCSGCYDFNKFCENFMQRGMCKKRLFEKYMKDVCPRACGICT